ncbi:hypothetical protein EYF80_026453 [Liparis tanakae]|uniref:Uncharacterized protein n=1 Tax=Liparis tanakae TaxID=230148 RepID=A0A4Z2HCJ7_9TELE|nr:hypothetical protein EYF80_026453 [Liparis tanakae]
MEEVVVVEEGVHWSLRVPPTMHRGSLSLGALFLPLANSPRLNFPMTLGTTGRQGRLCPLFEAGNGRDVAERASKSKMRLISEAVKVRLGMDQVSVIHPILPEQPLLTGYQSMYPPDEHGKQAV